MALVNCSKCGKPVSDRAVKCPHCGAKVHQAAPVVSRKALRTMGHVGILIILLCGGFLTITTFLGVIMQPCFYSYYYGTYYKSVDAVGYSVYNYLNQDAWQWLVYGRWSVTLLILGCFVYGIWKMVKKKPFSLKYCILSVLISIVPCCGISLIEIYIVKEAHSAIYEQLKSKVDAARGTFEGDANGGNYFGFSMAYKGEVKYGHDRGKVSSVEYNFTDDKFYVTFKWEEVNYNVYSYSRSTTTRRAYGIVDSDMTKISKDTEKYSGQDEGDVIDIFPASGSILLSKISDEVQLAEDR